MAVLGQHAVSSSSSPIRLLDRTYVAWGTVAFAYAIAFLQRMSPQTVGLSFMRDFGTDASGVAMLASSYFWGYTLMQIPAGLLVDRYGVKRVVLCSMAASVVGSLAFALSPTLFDVFIARVIVACGDALVFTALLKLVAQSFTDERFGLMSGISQVSGYAGGVIATTPLAAAVSGFGWRACFFFIACIGIANLACASVALKAAPSNNNGRTLKSVLLASWQALGSAANWGCAMSFASHFAVVTTLAGVWGIPMVSHYFGISPSAAGAPLLAFMVGNAIGSIFLGHAADRTRSLDAALIRISLLRMLLVAMLWPALAHAFGLVYVGVVFAVLGLVAGGTVPLILKCTKHLYTVERIGVGASINTTSAGVFAGLAQPVIAFAMMAASGLGAGDGSSLHAVANDAGYATLLAALLLMSLPGIFGPLMMRPRLTPNT
ncbi:MULTISPECIES: MFS transporter [Bradyrhizobium]|jgi:MFS family permease|uniref:MFS transporter n=1 Tax=Bradyrhizobium TaxID=374 RepID=UPI0003A7E80D|nr:MFS transporter [Bradyrhizobium denitrificans]MCL8485211.1 MFS transporter [Bradyrhizobium denitrificans]RTM01246.1 MAG: MFS transporter [Bradyrhizobiaceae bacterium]